ncbi:putative bifunctional diguanylate cyclase/phosphodiesterase [Thiolapillus sp.]
MMEKQTTVTTLPRVLIVDDDAMVRLLAISALGQLDLDLHEAGDGAEAVALFQQQAYDIVLLDLEMPRMDGFTAARRIRALPGGENATLIMVTGLNDADSIEKAYQVGATDFVTKPINWAILRQRLRFVLRARNAFRSLQENEAKLLESQRIANLGHWEWDIINNRAEWSEQVYGILGLDPQACDASFATFLQAVHPDEQRLFNRAVSAAIEKGESYLLEHRIVRPDGEERHVVSQGQALPAEPGKVERVRHVVQDITERKRAEEHIFQLANFDSLTGLPNRALFQAYAGRILAAAKRDGTKAAVLLLDLDRFKRINDSLGYQAGDQLIKEVAGRIASCMRECDLAAKIHTVEDLPYSLARPGGDEFMLLIRGVDRAAGVAHFAKRLSDALAQPLSVMQQEVFFSASIGISLFPDDAQDQDLLIKSADIALGYAKDSGGGCFRFFSEEMNDWANKRIELEARLNHAVENNELQLYYQPQISLVSGRLTGFEALLRWWPGGGDMVPPNEFIPIAEETGVITEIGAWVIHQACKQLRSWRDRGYDPVPVAVNVSARQFVDQNLVKIIEDELAAFDLTPELLELELTERVIMRSLEETRIKLQALKEVGVKLSVDDFGTGYSSMSYLKRFPLDALKIDRSFIMDLVTDSNDESIIRAIVAMSKGLGLHTIAEGVETDQQRELLSSIGCDLMQGFLYSRPLPAEEAESYLLRLSDQHA